MAKQNNFGKHRHPHPPLRGTFPSGDGLSGVPCNDCRSYNREPFVETSLSGIDWTGGFAMYESVITFRSLTAAQRAQSACRRRGIAAMLVRAPAGTSPKGCGHALQVAAADAGQVLWILRMEQIPVERVFRMNGGRAEEVAW